jgi:hypothetical protein
MKIARKRKYFTNDLFNIFLFVVGWNDDELIQLGQKLKAPK